MTYEDVTHRISSSIYIFKTFYKIIIGIAIDFILRYLENLMVNRSMAFRVCVCSCFR